jgi:hypothetical protein
MRRRRTSNRQPTEFVDRFIGALSYLTMGLVGFVWIIVSAISGNKMSSVLRYNIFQSIFIGILVYLFNIIMSIFYNLVMFIPGIKYIVGLLVFYLFQDQIIFGMFSILHFALILLIFYLAISAFQDKTPEIPWISRNVRQLM